MKPPILLLALCLTAQAHVRPIVRAVDWIPNEQGWLESWTWSHDYRGHPKVVIRNTTGGLVRIFVFDTPLR